MFTLHQRLLHIHFTFAHTQSQNTQSRARMRTHQKHKTYLVLLLTQIRVLSCVMCLSSPRKLPPNKKTNTTSPHFPPHIFTLMHSLISGVMIIIHTHTPQHARAHAHIYEAPYLVLLFTQVEVISFILCTHTLLAL